MKTGRRIMFKKSINVLMYYNHKLLGHLNGSSTVLKKNHLKYFKKFRQIRVMFLCIANKLVRGCTLNTGSAKFLTRAQCSHVSCEF